jgi:hypothetical protein
MIKLIKKHWPLIIALFLLLSTIIILLILSIRNNHGNLIYALDDPYIHMSMAKNLSQHGVWGINKYEFTSSSSSILWTLLLSLIYYLFGVNETSPFILNIIFAVLLVCLVYILFRKYSLRPLIIFIVLLIVIYFTPLPSLIFCGLEHTLHAFLTLLFVYYSAKILSVENSASKEYNYLLILAPLITSIRYEGLFLILVVCILLAFRKRLCYSFLLGGIAIIPIAICGVISTMNGWYFLPNSVLLKGTAPLFSKIEIRNFINHFYTQFAGKPHNLALFSAGLLLCFVQLKKQKSFWHNFIIMDVIYLSATLLHMLFAQAGWFYRYEAYLVALGIFVIAIGIHENMPGNISIAFYKRLNSKKLIIVILILILFIPVGKRGVLALLRTTSATTNIYEQHYQMSMFLQKYYQGESVAANDIGAINYFADIKCLDLWGLGSSEVANLMMHGRYSTQEIYNLAKQKKIKIALVYDQWFKKYGGIPSEWIDVGNWTISNNIVLGGNTVKFYAVDPLQRDSLIKNLRDFSPYLVKDVVQSGVYTKNEM